MTKENIMLLGRFITNAFKNNKIIPSELFKIISKVIPGDNKDVYKLFIDIWNKNNTGLNKLNINQQFLISRGFNNEITSEEQLSKYLPEEKILINKDLFRSHLENIDLINIDNKRQKQIMDILIKESIGLSNNDVLLYYNLLKINQISQSVIKQNSVIDDNRDYSSEIYSLTIKAFNLTPLNIKKINGSKNLDEKIVIEILRDGVKKKRINPYVLSICLGYKNAKFIKLFIDFITFLASQRGDDVQDILSYIGLYILINGTPEDKIRKLNLGSNVEAFIMDRIGRVKSIYYVAMLFIHTFNVLLTAQMFEISGKFQNSSLDQRLKLEKLYSADNRRSILVDNAINIATRKVSEYKNESLEVLSAFKRFNGTKNVMITVKDLFNIDYRF